MPNRDLKPLVSCSGVLAMIPTVRMGPRSILLKLGQYVVV